MKTKEMILASLMACLTIICSLIQFPLPFSPVPITLQVVAVTMAGILLGKNYGALSVLIYLLLGAIGLPVFAGGKGGFSVLLGPTGGFLISFVPAVYLIGMIKDRLFQTRNHLSTFHIAVAMLAGLIVIYFLGWIQLKIVTGMPWINALQAGVLPFIIPDTLKIILGSIVAKAVHRSLLQQGLLPQ